MRWTAWVGAAVAAVAMGTAAGAQPYPVRPVTFVVTAPAGGPSDIVARLVGERLSKAIGQPVVIENRAGAAQTLGTAAVAKAEPDGYTLLFTTSTPIMVSPHTMKVSYDVRRDLRIVAHVGSTPLVLYSNAQVPARSVSELIGLAKAKPGQVSYGSYGHGSSAHLLGEYLNKQAGISLVHVAYKGVAPQIQDLAGGHINVALADVGTPAEFVKSGVLNALAVTGSSRTPSLPDVPTFAEQGITGMEPFSAWWGLFAPAGTPAPIVEKLAAATVAVARSAEFGERLRLVGGAPTGISGPEAEALLYDELDRWKTIIAGLPAIKAE